MSHSLPSAALPLVPGAIVASVGLFGSIILQVAGPIPLALEKLGETGFNPATRVRIFALCFNRAAPIMIVTGFLGASLALFPTFAYPNPISKPYLRTAAVAFLSITPYTLMSLLDINKELLALNRAVSVGKAGDLSLPTADGKRAVELMHTWSFWAGWRTAFFAVGWVGMVMGLGKELRVI